MATATTTEVNVDERRPVWMALSEFFLDTELDHRDCRRIAHVLADSPYSIPELESIYRDEIAPVLWPNLMAVAGVWDAFDPDWLCAEAAKRAKTQSLALRAAKVVGADRLMTGPAEAVWRDTAAVIKEIRSETTR